MLGGVVLCLTAVATAAITYQSSQTAASTQVTYTTVDVSKPTSVASGDLMIASVAVHGGDMAVVSSVPTGWTLIGSTTNDGSLLLLSYWKIAGGSEPSSYEWQINGQTTAEGGITRYTGTHTSDPIDAASGNTGLGTTATTSAITTTAASDTIVTLFAVDEGKTTTSGSYFGTPTGMTERYDVSNTPFGPSIALDDVVQTTAGSVASKSSAIGGNNKAKNWASEVIALRPPTVTVVATGSQDVGYNSSGSFSADSGGGTACFVGFGGHNGVTVTSLTWGGSAMTQVARNDTVYSGWHADLWYIKNPPSGSQTLSYSYSGIDNALFGWVCTTGEAASPIGTIDNTSGGRNGTTTSMSITTTAPNSLIIGTSFNNNNSGTMSAVGPNVTLAWNVQELATPDTLSTNGLYQSATTIGTYTPGFSWTNLVDPFAAVGVEVLVQ